MDGICKVTTTIDDINEFITSRLGVAVDGQPFELVNATFLTILLDRQGPEDMTLEELQEGVRLASGTITTYLSTLRPQTAGETVN